MFWSHSYKGHHIQGKVEGNTETIEVLLHDREGPGFTQREAKTYHAAKLLITRHVNRPTPTLAEIIRSTAWRMRDVEIDVDTAYGTVAIGSNIFMQGDEAVQFITEAETLYEKAQYVSMDDCYACVAAPIYENLEH